MGNIDRLAWSASVLAIVMFGAACSSAREQADGQFERVSAGLIFDGDLNRSNIQFLMGALNLDDVLIIDSMDGNDSDALRLSRYIVQNRISVIVNGQCTGACAFYAFLPAHMRKVAVGASLRFDLSPLSFSESTGSPRPTLTTAERETYRKVLRDAGVSEDLLRCTDRVLLGQIGAGTQVLDSARRETPDRYTEVAVSRDVLKEYGVSVVGRYEWPDDAEYWRSYGAEFSPRMTRIDSPTSCE